jgi:uncharacterized membrane protein
MIDSASTPTAHRAAVTAGHGVRSPRARRLNTALWVIQVATSLFFLVSAFPKLIGHPSASVVFDKIGWGDWLMYLTGSLELAGAIGLLIPLLSGLAGLAYIGLMVGAFITQVTVMDGQNAATPIIVAVVVAVIAWGRRRNTAELFARLTRR